VRRNASAVSAASQTAELADRLRERLPEIEGAIFARMVSVADPAEVEDPEYVAGLREAVRAGIAYGLAAAEDGDALPEPIPLPLLAQARAAARLGISLDVVLRRYFAGYTLFAEFIVEEAEKQGPVGAEESRRLSRAQAPLFDRLVAAVTAEYREEVKTRRRSVEHTRAERVRRLLAGELVDEAELGYELGASHLGAVAAGPGAVKALHQLAVRLGRRLLLVRPGEGAVWAWFGGQTELCGADVAAVAESTWPAEARLAVGESGEGLPGWRLTHRQALAAFPIAELSGTRIARYGGFVLLAAALSDELISESLRRLYIAPLAGEPDRGATLCLTLRAYFASGGNVSSAASALGVGRKTVTARLRTFERWTGRSLDEHAAEVDTALRLQDLLATGAT
jgi:PucR C-terminal helix-turn-helix domain